MTEPQSRSLTPAPCGFSGANESQQRRKNVGTACSVCKARKLKCSGTAPCTNCVKNNTECTLDASTDRRRRGGLKRKLSHLEENEDLLVRLVSTIRESSNRRTIQLLNLIQSNASLPEIKRYIDTQLAGFESEKTPELIEVCNEIQRFERAESASKRRIFDTQREVEPLFQVPAGPWTTVTADDADVSHLVSLWFTWAHPFYNWIDRGLFLRDMNSGDLESRFCSPFLVNVILADASAYSDGSNSSAQGVQFYNEAKRLLDKEEGRYTLATAQGIGILWTCALMNGKDRHGWIHRSQLVYAVQELSQSTIAQSRVDKDGLDLSQVTKLTIWGLFNVAMTRVISDKKVPLIKPPRKLPTPPISHDIDADSWIPYPSKSEKLQAHTSCTFRALCDLNEIAYEITCPFLQEEMAASKFQAQADELHRRLQEWADKSPICLEGREAIEVPHILSLHMYRHAIVITVYDLIKKSGTIGEHHTSNTSTSTQSLSRDPDEVRLSSARSISQLMRVHRSSWGVDRMPEGTSQWINIALSALLERLDIPENADAFVNLSIAAKAASRRWSSSKSALDKIHSAATALGFHIPIETEPLFTHLEARRQYSHTSSESPLVKDDSVEATDGDGSEP